MMSLLVRIHVTPVGTIASPIVIQRREETALQYSAGSNHCHMRRTPSCEVTVSVHCCIRYKLFGQIQLECMRAWRTGTGRTGR
eukprot:COSAG02_NODE_423_length_22576_cov_62.034791_10_plen_83_part_00